jgi:5-methylthioadenosine/S-adenosylhomocysteine deaminase
MQTCCIQNATIVTMNARRDIIRDGHLVVQGNRIVALGEGPCPAPFMAGSTVLDCHGKIVFPGLINTHNHLFQTLTKGLGDDKVLSDWLTSMTFPAATRLTAEDVHAAAMHGCVEGIRSGTTTMFDYMYPHPQAGLSDAVLEAFSQLKLRGILARGMMDTGGQFGTPQGIMQDVQTVERDCLRLFQTWHRSANDRIRIWVAPAAIWSNTSGMLRTVWDITNSFGSGLSVHISETPFDREASRQLHGRPDAELLQELGILGPNVLMVHCVYLTERDMRMARHHDMKVSHNTISNMYLSSGVAPVPAMIERGITVGLGTDGPASNNCQDMIELLKFTALMHKAHSKDPTVITAEKVLEMATIDGAAALGLQDEVGSLETGKKADLFIYDPMRSPKSIPCHDPVSTLVYAGSSSCVETVLVDGEALLLDGNLMVADEAMIAATCQRQALDLARRAGMSGKGGAWRSRAF